MAVGVIMMIPDGTQQMYDQAMENLGLTADGGVWPEGILTHNAGPSDEGWMVVDTWESKEAFGKFAESRLMEAVQKAGIPPLEPKFFEVYVSYKA